MIRVFLDANVYFAGFHSPKGASGFVLELIRRKKIEAYASRLVLREADRNLRSKSDSKVLKAFRRYLQSVKVRIVPAPDESLFKPHESYLHPKDLPVLAAALLVKSDFLITLDRRHFLTPQVPARVTKIKICTPHDFIRDVYLKGKV